MASSEQPSLRALLRDGSLAGTWTLDPARSEVALHTRHTWGLLPLRGVFHQVSGSGAVTKDGDASGVITVTAESVDTTNPRRDKHLRSAAFFDVAHHPEFTFAVDRVTPADSATPADGATPADSATPAESSATVTGTLTVRDRTRPASFVARVSTAGGEVVLDGELPVNRRDYGLNWNFIGIAAMDSTIAVHAVFTRQ